MYPHSIIASSHFLGGAGIAHLCSNVPPRVLGLNPETSLLGDYRQISLQLRIFASPASSKEIALQFGKKVPSTISYRGKNERDLSLNSRDDILFPR
jgi:hypothetical protein